MIRLRAILILGFLSLAPAGARAIEVPRLTGPVVDQAGMLTPSQEAELSGRIQALHAGGRGPQIAILTVNTLEGEPIEQFSIRVTDQWKLGDAKRDDGILILVSSADRSMRIEVGQGLEGDLPDAIASRIIRGILIPAFRSGDYHGGFSQALNAVISAIGGDPSLIRQPAPTQRRSSRRASPFFLLIFLMFFLFRMLAGPRYRRGRGVWAIGGWPGAGGGFRHGGGGFGGGFGGFGGGGGGFSGGGASGRW